MKGLVLMLGLAACSGDTSALEGRIGKLETALADVTARLAKVEEAAKLAMAPRVESDDERTKRALDRMDELADVMCKCKTASCADAASAHMLAVSQRMADDPGRPKVNPEVETRGRGITKRFSDCMMATVGK